MIQTERKESIVIIRLDRSVTNAIGVDLVAALSGALHAAADDPTVSAVVLSTASEKFFSIGLDIPSLYPLSRADFGQFMHAFNGLCLSLITLPKPTVAAVRGHAVAGGCVLAMCCDYRVIGAGKKLMGLNEAKLGVPVPWPAFQALVHLVGSGIARRVVDSVSFYGPEELLRFGLVDRIADSEDAETSALEQAAQLAEIPVQTYRAIKADRLGPMIGEVRARLEEKERIFLDCWFSPTTQKNLKAAMLKF